MRLFDGDVGVAHRYLIEHRTERDNLTLSQLLLSRQQRAVELHMDFLEATRSGAL